ncbi:MAG: hypothetical protein IKR41_06415 [Bacteroidales bacterium]|nr:hypothetical protein [Bacteroidales bacterium]
MKKIYSWMLAAAFLGGSTLTMTSCHKDDKEDEPAPLEQPQEQKDERPMSEIVSKVMVEHIRNNVKSLAENYSNGAFKTMVYGGSQIFAWTKYNKKFMTEIQEYFLKGIKAENFKAVDEKSDLAKEGYTKYLEVTATDMGCCYEFVMKSAKETGTKQDEPKNITPAEKLTLVFPLDLDGMAEKCKVVLTDAGTTYEEKFFDVTKAVTGKDDSKGEYAVVIKIPESYNFEISLLSDGEYKPAFDGEFVSGSKESISKTGTLPSYDFSITINSHLNGYSQYGIRDDESKLVCNYKTTLNTDDSESGNLEFAFSQNGMDIIDTKLQVSFKETAAESNSGKEGKTEAEVKEQIVPFKMEQFKFADLLKMAQGSFIEGLSIDDLTVTVLDDLTAEVKMPDCAAYLATRLKSIDARHNWADQTTMDSYAKELNDNITMSLTMKGLNMPVPVRMQTAEFGAGQTIMPAVQLDGTENYTPIKQLLDLETMEYLTYIADDYTTPLIDLVNFLMKMSH